MNEPCVIVKPAPLANDADKWLQSYIKAAVPKQQELCSFFSIDGDNIPPDIKKVQRERRNRKM